MRPSTDSTVLRCVLAAAVLLSSACGGGSDEIPLPQSFDALCDAIDLNEVKDAIEGSISVEEGATSRRRGCSWWVDVGNDNVQVDAVVVSESFEAFIAKRQELIDFTVEPTTVVGDEAAFLGIGFGGYLVMRDGQNVWDIEVNRIPADYNASDVADLPNADATRLATYLAQRFSDPA